MRGSLMGAVRASFVLASFVFFGACSDEDPPLPIHPTAPAFRSLDVTGSVMELVDPDVGTTLTVGGARLEIPPGALASAAEITLIETSNPAAGLRVDDGGLDGQAFLWDRTYAFVSDRQVDLRAPIFLDLPVDPARLPPGMGTSAGQISAVTGGYVVVQGEESSATDTHLRMTIAAPFLTDGPSFSGGARAFGSVPFVVITSGLLAAGATLQGLIATIDDVRSIARFQVVLTDHFRIRFRSTSMERAQGVADILERSYAFFVDELGFSLPNLINLDGRYTVYLDDFNNHSFGSGAFPDGMTLPGSLLVEGASYVNVTDGKLPDTFESVAVHEYFHAVQYGALTRIVPNAAGKVADLQSGWLFEGTAALMAGRMTSGGIGPRIDRGLGEHQSPRWSIYAIPRAVDPPADAAQELFFYIERELGITDHYRAMFERLGTDLPFVGDREPSVSAVEEVLRERGTNLGEMFGQWVRDYLFDHPSDYGGAAPPNVPARLDTTGTRPLELALSLPPLSYDHRVYTVPALEPDATGEEPTDVEVRLSVREGDPFDLIVFVESDGEVEELLPIELNEETSTVLFRVRQDVDREVRIAFANRGLDDEASVMLDLSVLLGGEGGPPPDGIPDAEEGIVVVQSRSGTTTEIRGLNIGNGTRWSVPTDGAANEVTLTGSSDRGDLLIAESDDTDRLLRLLVVDDFGRGTARDILTESACPGLIGEALFGRMDAEGRVWFIGDVDFDGTPRAALFRDGAAGCTRLPIDFDGDGMDDTGESGIGYHAVIVSRDGLRLGLQGAGLGLHTAPASGGRAVLTALNVDRVEDQLDTLFSIAEDGSSITARAGSRFLWAPADGGELVELDSNGRTGSALIIGGGRVFFPVTNGFATQLPGEPIEFVELPDEAQPRGALVPAHAGGLFCFTGTDVTVDPPTQSAYCGRESGAALVRVMAPEPDHVFDATHYWPDAR